MIRTIKDFHIKDEAFHHHFDGKERKLMYISNDDESYPLGSGRYYQARGGVNICVGVDSGGVYIGGINKKEHHPLVKVTNR